MKFNFLFCALFSSLFTGAIYSMEKDLKSLRNLALSKLVKSLSDKKMAINLLHKKKDIPLDIQDLIYEKILRKYPDVYSKFIEGKKEIDISLDSNPEEEYWPQVKFTLDNNLIIGENSTLRLINPETGEVFWKVNCPKIKSFFLSPDNKFIATLFDSESLLCLRNLATGELIYTLNTKLEGSATIADITEQNLIVIFGDYMVQVRNLENNGNLLNIISQNALQDSYSNGYFLVSNVNQKKMEVFCIDGTKKNYELLIDTSGDSDAIIIGSRFIIAYQQKHDLPDKGKIYVWNFLDGSLKYFIEYTDKVINFATDTKKLIVALENGEVYISNLIDGKLIKILPIQFTHYLNDKNKCLKDGVFIEETSDNDKLLISSSFVPFVHHSENIQPFIYLWHITTGNLICKFPFYPRQIISSLTISSDASSFAVGCTNNNIDIYKIHDYFNKKMSFEEVLNLFIAHLIENNFKKSQQ